MARNDPHCARAVEVLAGNVVGTGMVPRFTVAPAVPPSLAKLAPKADASAEQGEALDTLWRLWAEHGADAEGVHTLEALQAVAARAWIEGGEAFIVRVWDKTAVGVPMRIEVYEADMCDPDKNATLTDAVGKVTGRIVQGVEFDARNRRVAYWFFDQHPGESGTIGALRTTATRRILARDVRHLFLPLRPKQVRGLPFLAPILGMKADLDTWERFELARKQTEAAVAAFVIPGDNAEIDADEGLVPAAVDDNGDTVEDIQPRLILRLRNGKEVRFNTPQISGNYDTYKRAMLQSIAVGVHLSYERLTGDHSGTNLSTLRAGENEFWRYIDALQWNHFAPKVCAGIAGWFLEAAYMADLIASPSATAEWTAPARSSLDPESAALVDILEIRAGLAPRSEKAQARGYNLRDLLREMARDNELIDKLSVVLDSDAKRMAFRGAFAQGVQGTPLADEAPDAAKVAA